MNIVHYLFIATIIRVTRLEFVVDFPKTHIINIGRVFKDCTEYVVNSVNSRPTSAKERSN